MAEQPELKWSAAFRVAAQPTDRALSLQGDKIILPQSALEQLLSASTALSSSLATSANPYVNARSRPQNAFYADSHQQLPDPLMFRLVNQANGNVVHAGIREFSAPDDVVLLSSYLLEALGISESELSFETPNGATANDAVDLTRDDEETSCATTPTPTPPGPRITIHAKQLPRGTYVRLRPLEAGYDPGDWKSLLERQLRQSFTTLTRGAFLAVRGVKGETFRFLIDKFQPEGDGICVVDTDLEVDIEALNEEQARETMRQIMAKSQKAPGTAQGSSVGGELSIWKDVEGRVLPGEFVDYELESWPRSRPLEITLSELDDEYSVDLLISPKSTRQRAHPRDIEHVFATFTFSEPGTKRIAIPATAADMDDAESLLVTVRGYRPEGETGPARDASAFKLRVKSIKAEALSPTTNGPAKEATEEPKQTSPDDEQCQTCLQWIPKRTMVLHENFCRRNNVVCPHCRSVFQKSSDDWANHWHCSKDDGAHGNTAESQAKHDSLFHTERACPACTFTTNSVPDLARHRTSVCPGKIILCQFCHLEVPQEGDPFSPSAESLLSGLTEHELADGARTTDCHLCSKIIRLRDMATHLKHHDLEKAHRPRPAICRNANCGRTQHGVGRNGVVGSGTQMGQGAGNNLGLCSLCYSPLYVSLHDPEGKALRRRIERRYLTQLTTGCQKRWCRNEWCKMGRANMGLDPLPPKSGGGGTGGTTTTTSTRTGVAAVLPLVKPLVDNIQQLHVPMFFCVDETNQRRRALAEMLAAEGGWDLEWCVAACEAEGGDMDRVREWLGNWAPMKA
ncbi:ubiquitin fusion degradation protein 1 [Microdochium nivale]|nr:ubiquitin fusion degradation protein 1 [Microdochium nivale]